MLGSEVARTAREFSRSDDAGDRVVSFPQTGRTGDNGPAAYSLLDNAIARLAEIVDQETAALRSRAVIDLEDFSNRKSQGLLELNKALRLFDNAVVDQGILAQIAVLREKLDINRAVLKMHLDAVREISSLVTDAIRDAESDGTYSASISGSGKSL